MDVTIVMLMENAISPSSLWQEKSFAFFGVPENVFIQQRLPWPVSFFQLLRGGEGCVLKRPFIFH
jgi:hypothetical protein